MALSVMMGRGSLHENSKDTITHNQERNTCERGNTLREQSRCSQRSMHLGGAEGAFPGAKWEVGGEGEWGCELFVCVICGDA